MGKLPICDWFLAHPPTTTKNSHIEAIPPAKSAEGSFDAPQASHSREKVTSASFHLKWNAIWIKSCNFFVLDRCIGNFSAHNLFDCAPSALFCLLLKVSRNSFLLVFST